MNDSVSPQRRRPPGWRASRDAPDDGQGAGGVSAGDTTSDTAFDRGETVERPAIRLPVAEPEDDDHPLFGRADDRDGRTDPVGHDLDDDHDDDYNDEDLDGTESDPHPVAVPLAGFFTGMVYILGLPVLYVWLSDPDSLADSIGVDLAWLLAAILVPVFLTAIPQTRTFGRYMLFGVGLSAVVVIGVAAIVLAVLIFLV